MQRAMATAVLAFGKGHRDTVERKMLLRGHVWLLNHFRLTRVWPYW